MISAEEKLELSKDITLLRKKTQEVEPLSHGLSAMETMFNSIAATIKNQFTLDRFEAKENKRVWRETVAEVDVEPLSPGIDASPLGAMFDILSAKLDNLRGSGSGGGGGGGILPTILGGAALAGAGYIAYEAMKGEEKTPPPPAPPSASKTPSEPEKQESVKELRPAPPIAAPMERNARVEVAPTPTTQENRRRTRTNSRQTADVGIRPVPQSAPPVRQVRQNQPQAGGIDWKSMFSKGILATPFGLAAGVAAGTSKIVKDVIDDASSGFEEGTEGVTPMSGNAAAKRAMDYFVSKGWTKEQAAGLVGNLQVESGNFSPNIISGKKRGDSGKAVGIAQWHPDRQARFKEKYGKSIVGASLDEQLAFIQHELETSERSAAEKLRRAKTAAEAAVIVDAHYERSAGSTRKQRIANARSLAGKNGIAAKASRAAGAAKRGIDTAGAKVAEFIRGGPTKGASAAIVSVGQALQKQGLRVSENAAFGGVEPVHKGRGHYEDRAIDVNVGKGNVEARDPVLRKKFDELAKTYSSAGYLVIWRGRYWRNGKASKENPKTGHYDHMHIEAPIGSNLPIPQIAKPVQNRQSSGKNAQQASQDVKVRKIKRNRRVVVKPGTTKAAIPVVASSKSSKPTRIAANAGEKYRRYFG